MTEPVHVTPDVPVSWDAPSAVVEPTPFDPVRYWEHRYATGKTSGAGSRGTIAVDKAAEINALIRREQIASVVDWGCGDGYLLEQLRLPDDYLGIDISRTAIGVNLWRFGHHQFLKWNPNSQIYIHAYAELALSVDVLFHLTDDDHFHRYLAKLFDSATRYVLIYSTDGPDGENEAPHVRHRQWTHLVPDPWELVRSPEGSYGRWIYARPGAQLEPPR